MFHEVLSPDFVLQSLAVVQALPGALQRLCEGHARLACTRRLHAFDLLKRLEREALDVLHLMGKPTKGGATP